MTLVKKSPAQIYRALDVLRTVKELIAEDSRQLDKIADLSRFRECVNMVAWVKLRDAESQLERALTPEVILQRRDGETDKALFDLIAPFRSIGPRKLKRLLDARLSLSDS